MRILWALIALILIPLNLLWENLKSSMDYKKEDGNSLTFTITVGAGKEEVITLEVSGKNLTQGFIFDSMM